MPFVRRFQSRPSNAVLMAVAGVVIIDEPPPVAANSAVFGKVAVVGEFEDGPFNTLTDILTSRDQPRIFGGLGYTVGAKRYQYPCALKSGGTEPFNGNGYVQIARLPFAKLALCRVDTSVGSIALTPLAFVQSKGKLAPYVLTAGQTFIWERDGVTRTATFAAAAAVKDGAGGTFNSFTGGEQISIELNGAAAVVVTFLAGDTTIAAIVSRINAAFGFTFASNNAGQLRLTSDRLGTGSSVKVLSGAAATTLGFDATQVNGTGDAANIAAVTVAEVQTKVTATDAGSAFRLAADGSGRIVSLTAGTGTVRVLAGTANSALGFTDTTGGAITGAGLPAATTIAAGTRARGAGGDATRVVTMQSTDVAKGSTATQLLKVRPAIDDGTYAGLGIAAVTVLEDAPGGYEWAVGNPVALSAALTLSQIESRYLTAIDATKGVGNDVTKKVNGVVSARQSDVIRGAILSNAVSASGSGHASRRAFLCPPNGSSAQVALQAAAPGVGAYRDEAGTFAAGGIRCYLQELVDGGYADATTGEIVRHPDTFLASRFSVLGPGYNPAQFPEESQYRFDQTTFPGLESAASSWDVDTYVAFKAGGVCGAEFDKDTGIVFGDGVTTVDPASAPDRVNISRHSLAGYIGDTLSSLAKVQVKRQGTERRRENLKQAFEGFLDQLVGTVVEAYEVDVTTDALPAGAVQYTVTVSQLGSDDVIVINERVGPNAL